MSDIHEGISPSNGWKGIIHKFVGDPLTPLVPSDLERRLTLCGRTIALIHISDLADADRPCRICMRKATAPYEHVAEGEKCPDCDGGVRR